MAEGIPSINVKIKTKSNRTDGIKTGSSISKSAINAVSSKLQSELSGKNDLGSQAAGMGIKTVDAGVQSFKAAQVASDVSLNGITGICKVGKGIYQVGLTGMLGVVTVAQTVSKLREGQIKPLSSEAVRTLRSQAFKTGLSNTELSRRLIYSAKNIHRKVKSAINTTVNIGHGIKTGYKVVRGAISSKTTFKISKEAVKKFALKALSKSMVAVNGSVYKLSKGSIQMISSAATSPLLGTGLSTGLKGGAGTLQNSDDYALQGAGSALRGAELGIRTSIKGIKVSKYTVKTTIKTGKKVVHAGMFIKNNGLRAAWKAARGYGAKSAQNLLKAMLNVFKALGRKVVIPILIIATVVMACSGVITVPVTAVASIFGSFFSTKDTKKNFDIKDFLNTSVPGLITGFQDDLAGKLEESRAKYDIVRLKSNISADETVSATKDGIISVFPSNDEVINMIQPVFNAVILMKYDLEPTEKQAEDLVEEIFDKLFSVSTAKTTEYCGQDLLTGKGTVLASHTCGEIHAKDDCPNKKTGTHKSYTCDNCCTMSCPGHAADDGTTTYCPGCTNTCSGYTYCGSHSVMTYTLSVEGVYALENIYFKEPMEKLLNKENRTDEEETKLAQLQDYHEIFREMMNEATVIYNSGITMADLSGVKFKENNKRNKNQEIVKLALSQIGQKGGQPFWSFLGYKGRVEWCACFVNWCMRKTPSATNKYSNLPGAQNASCINVSNYFKSKKQFADRNYTDLVAGDVIFFNCNSNVANHIGIVIGVDDNYVYTVEGNTPGDVVARSRYHLKSNIIYGYGLMNY